MIFLNIFKKQQKIASSDIVTNFHDSKKRLFQWNYILWINSITRHNELKMFYGIAEKARLEGFLLLRLVSITVTKSYAQLLIALWKRMYLDLKPLGNFQDSQADFRKRQEKNVKNISESSAFSRNRTEAVPLDPREILAEVVARTLKTGLRGTRTGQ